MNVLSTLRALMGSTWGERTWERVVTELLLDGIWNLLEGWAGPLQSLSRSYTLKLSLAMFLPMFNEASGESAFPSSLAGC